MRDNVIGLTAAQRLFEKTSSFFYPCTLLCWFSSHPWIPISLPFSWALWLPSTSLNLIRFIPMGEWIQTSKFKDNNKSFSYFKKKKTSLFLGWVSLTEFIINKWNIYIYAHTQPIGFGGPVSIIILYY